MEATNQRANLENKVIQKMTSTLGYERRNIIRDMIIEGTYHTVDLAIVDHLQKKLIGVVEFIKVGGSEDDNALDNLRKERQKIFLGRYEGLKVFFVVYKSDDEGKTKLLTLNVDSQEENIGEYKSLDEFPTYEQLVAPAKMEQTRAIKENYKSFKYGSRILGGLSLILFLGSIFHAEIHITGRTQYKILLLYTLNIDYPNIILFGISIVLILMPFLQKIETLRFKIDLTEENNK